VVAQRGALAGRLALYTTIHPGSLRFAAEWYRSTVAQTDRAVDLWISVDGLEVEAVVGAVGERPEAVWRAPPPGSSKAEVRSAVLEELTAAYPAVILVDSDDVLLPGRVQAARQALAESDVTGCALAVMDERGGDLGITFAPPHGVDPAGLLVRYNVFGLSNTAYRSEVLRDCLPLPSDVELIDWLLATRARALGASLRFDRTPWMRYRQYDANTAPVLPPFTAAQVLAAGNRVRDHYVAVLRSDSLAPSFRASLTAAQERVEAFCRAMTSPAAGQAYVRALNRLSPWYVWWWSVAHPELEELWRS
jgi:hypothetical protein